MKQIDAANFSPLVTSSDAANPPRVISIDYFEMLAPFYAVLVHSLVECDVPGGGKNCGIVEIGDDDFANNYIGSPEDLGRGRVQSQRTKNEKQLRSEFKFVDRQEYKVCQEYEQYGMLFLKVAGWDQEKVDTMCTLSPRVRERRQYADSPRHPTLDSSERPNCRVSFGGADGRTDGVWRVANRELLVSAMPIVSNPVTNHPSNRARVTPVMPRAAFQFDGDDSTLHAEITLTAFMGKKRPIRTGAATAYRGGHFRGFRSWVNSLEMAEKLDQIVHATYDDLGAHPPEWVALPYLHSFVWIDGFDQPITQSDHYCMDVTPSLWEETDGSVQFSREADKMVRALWDEFDAFLKRGQDADDVPLDDFGLTSWKLMWIEWSPGKKTAYVQISAADLRLASKFKDWTGVSKPKTRKQGHSWVRELKKRLAPGGALAEAHLKGSNELERVLASLSELIEEQYEHIEARHPIKRTPISFLPGWEYGSGVMGTRPPFVKIFMGKMTWTG